MSLSTFIGIINTIHSMREFQKKNGITKQCITNAQYLYDTIKANGSNDVKVKAVIVVSFDDAGTCEIVGGHLVVMFDNTLVDPSYEVFSLKNKEYFDNIKDTKKYLDIIKVKAFDNKMLTAKVGIDTKQVLRHHIEFMKIAEQINSGKFLVTEKKFYNDQSDYIEKLFK